VLQTILIRNPSVRCPTHASQHSSSILNGLFNRRFPVGENDWLSDGCSPPNLTNHPPKSASSLSHREAPRVNDQSGTTWTFPVYHPPHPCPCPPLWRSKRTTRLRIRFHTELGSRARFRRESTSTLSPNAHLGLGQGCLLSRISLGGVSRGYVCMYVCNLANLIS
jgi:hypothetical protein